MENKLFLSKNIVLEESIVEGGILVNRQGTISKILNVEDVTTLIRNNKNIQIIDVGEYVIMPGIIDSHVHVNEPGRTEWEGFESATKAAAAGGVTTIADMPLNSIPPTTNVENFKTKMNHAKGKVYVDVAFWGGLIPGNHVKCPPDENNQKDINYHLASDRNIKPNELLKMIDTGIVGFKCFLCPSGVDEFPSVNMKEVELALHILENSGAALAFHAEVEEDVEVLGDSTCYQTFLNSRPDSMEINAIKNIIQLAEKYSVPSHIVHLSTSHVLPMLEEAKKSNPLLTVETCHHYLTISSEDIPLRATEFKCCPPIRDSKNRESLWNALKNNVIDMVVSDHSPCTADLKLLEEGDFMNAWGGISSLQFGLSLFWTEGLRRNISVLDVKKYMSEMPAKLIGLHKRKGKIAKDFDADFVIWNPNAVFTVNESITHHKNKVTPYMRRQLQGKVLKTIVRGKIVYEENKPFTLPVGKLLVKETLLY